jgi:hypothetical protein
MAFPGLSLHVSLGQNKTDGSIWIFYVHGVKDNSFFL